MNERQTSGHPPGLYLLFVTEMWERFSYYGMRAIFVLFMSKALLMSTVEASTVYGSYGGLVYLTPLLGGYMADRFLGNRRSIFMGGLMMALGQFLMFLSGSNIIDGQQSDKAISLMWAGLTCLIIGNGFFKPNISTMSVSSTHLATAVSTARSRFSTWESTSEPFSPRWSAGISAIPATSTTSATAF